MDLDNLFNRIPSEDRIPTLEAIALSFSKEDNLKVNFICTHNSRRSHFCEILFRTAAHYYGLKNVQTFSGGTESTSLYPEVAEIFFKNLERKETTPILFSKKYNIEYNAQGNYHAVMVCDSANETCPVVHGCIERHSLIYEDPKKSDGKQNQSNEYDKTLTKIASELAFIIRRFSLLT